MQIYSSRRCFLHYIGCSNYTYYWSVQLSVRCTRLVVGSTAVWTGRGRSGSQHPAPAPPRLAPLSSPVFADLGRF